MTLARQYAGAAAGLLGRDARVFVSYRARFLTQLLAGFFSLAMFYYLSRLVTVGEFRTPDTYFAFAVVGMVILQVLASTLTVLPGSIRQELVAGTFERLVVSPFGPVASVVAMTVFPFVVAFLQGIVTLALAAILFDLSLEWSTVPLAVPVALLGALAFAPFALLVAAAVLTFKQAGAGAGFVVTVISLVGGFFFPVSLLPDWIQWVSQVQPFTPTLDLLRELLVGIPIDESSWTAVLKVAAFLAVLMPLSVLTLNASVRFSQRRGTIIEY